MTLTERAALRVLARQANAAAFQQQAAERQSLTGRPVDALTGLNRLRLRLKLARDLRVQRETVGHVRQRHPDLPQGRRRNRGRLLGQFHFLLIDRMEPGPVTFQPVCLVRLVGFRRGVGVLQRLGEFVQHRLRLGGWNRALRRQLLGIQGPGRLQPVDRLVHQRLGECRFVRLVMAVTAVADDVQDDVGRELHAVFSRHPRAENHRLRVVAVHMQDRRLDRLRHIGAVQPGIRMRRHRGEADLVIHNKVDRPAGAVADQLAHRQRLINQALPGKRRIAMHQNRHHRPAHLRVARSVLPCPHLPDDHRIDRFQMRRVGLQRQMHGVPGNFHVGRGPEVIFHVARPLHVVRLEAGAGKLAEQRGQRLLDDIDQRVQPPAMRHSDRDLDHAAGCRHADHRMQRRDGDLAAFQAEPLGGDIALLAERLEPLGLGQL